MYSPRSTGRKEEVIAKGVSLSSILHLLEVCLPNVLCTVDVNLQFKLKVVPVQPISSHSILPLQPLQPRTQNKTNQKACLILIHPSSSPIINHPPSAPNADWTDVPRSDTGHTTAYLLRMYEYGCMDMDDNWIDIDGWMCGGGSAYVHAHHTHLFHVFSFSSFAL